MNNSSRASAALDFVAKAYPLLVVYAVACSLTYLLGYFSARGVLPFRYISFDDIVISSIYFSLFNFVIISFSYLQYEEMRRSQYFLNIQFPFPFINYRIFKYTGFLMIFLVLLYGGYEFNRIFVFDNFPHVIPLINNKSDFYNIYIPAIMSLFTAFLLLSIAILIGFVSSYISNGVEFDDIFRRALVIAIYSLVFYFITGLSYSVLKGTYFIFHNTSTYEFWEGSRYHLYVKNGKMYERRVKD